MRGYLKIFFSVIFVSVFTSVVVHAADMAQQPPDNSPAATTNASTPQPSSPAPLAPAPSYYNYASDEAEYSVMLPEAPEVKTIWRESPETTPFLQDPPADSADLGEIATFKRVDIDTEETFDVKITFLKAKRSFLQDLTEEKIKEILDKQYKGIPLSNRKFTFSAGASTTKWAVLSGFTIVPHQPPSFTAIHYLTGQQSILVVQVTYSVENNIYQDYYNKLVNSITYVAP